MEFHQKYTKFKEEEAKKVNNQKEPVAFADMSSLEQYCNVEDIAEQDHNNLLQAMSGLDKLHSEEASPWNVVDSLPLAQTNVTYFEVLGKMLDRHEATIHARWLAKKVSQRREILLRAFDFACEMAPHHRPDWTYFRKKGLLPEHDSDAPFLLMCPYINQEDLVKPHSLLLFMSSRGRSHPANFAAADLEAMHLGISLKYLRTGHLPHLVMMFTERQYGIPVPIDASRDASEQRRLVQGLSTGEGILVLHAHDFVLFFLCRCAREILHDVSEQDLISGPTSPPPKPFEETDNGFASLKAMAAEAPYRLPALLDWDRIVSLLAAKCSQTADHLRSLREDPGYFHRYAEELHDQRYERIPDAKGLANPDMKPANGVGYWTRVWWDAVFIDHLHFEMFSELQTQAETLRTLCQLNASTINPRNELPEEYMHAILRFRHFLRETACVMSQRLHIFQTAPWREYYFCTVLDRSLGFHRCIIALKSPNKLNDIQNRLRLDLEALTAFKERHTANHEPNNAATLREKLYGMTLMMDALQHLIESEPQAKAMITPCAACRLGELSLLSECLHQLEIYQPWARTFDASLTKEKYETFQSEYYEHNDSTEHYMTVALMACEQNLGRLGAPSNGRFSYPIEKRMTKENVTALRNAESNLDAFWHVVDTWVIKSFGQAPSKKTAIQRIIMQPRTWQRTPAWIEPQKKKPQSRPLAAQDLHVRFAELEFERRHLTEQTISKEEHAPKLKSRTKTRGVATQVETQFDAQGAPNHDTHDNKPMFAVDARSLKVFKTIFFTQSISATPGEIKWIDFLHAMVAVGFAPEKLSGSTWHFKPTRPGMRGSINFHEPHKEIKTTGKIPYSIARNMGSRLTRAYGLDASSFTLAEKKKAEQ
jgi:hypothetical protein